MGSPESEYGRFVEEIQHDVMLTKSFEIMNELVTQAQWQEVMGNNPSQFTGNDRPVERVSWNDVQEFIKKCNHEKAIHLYRLPTEAEWEYCRRAGTTTPYSGYKIEDLAWFHSNSEKQTHAVAQKSPNAWGLYDMHGNVWEWCQDWYYGYPKDSVIDPVGPATGSYRVLHGGSWYNAEKVCGF